ncbi:MAG: HIT domain-containing protein [Bdellovibrionaceae bacterium]|nr:HIT domain-containing protein [Pseudobdellovibrionaceae bacterium]
MAGKASKKGKKTAPSRGASKKAGNPGGKKAPAAGRPADASWKKVSAAKDIWPFERDILFRPDRFKYVRKLVKPEGCVFCRAGEEEPSFETLCVFQNEHSMVVLNKFPYNSGHLLVLPRRHVGDLLQLKNDEYQVLMATLRFAMASMQDLYQPGGINAGLNHGQAAGAGIPDHLHFHLIPRWAGDLNFFPLIADTKVVIETLEQTWDRYSNHFRAHPGRTP